MSNFKLVIPQRDVLASAGRKIGENFLGPWLDRLIDMAFDTLEKTIKDSRHE